MVDEIRTLMQQGKWEDARAACEQLIFEHPTYAPAHAHLGICNFHANQFTDAAKNFERATMLDPHYWEAGIKHAQCLDRLQKYDEAYTVATHWQVIRPSDPTLAQMIKGLTYHLSAKITDSWQISSKPMHHNVTLSQD